MKLINLQYMVKERINLFALNTYKNYESLIEFNKICDYEPCEFSYPSNKYAQTRYNRKMRQIEQVMIEAKKEMTIKYLEILLIENVKLYSTFETIFKYIDNIKYCQKKSVRLYRDDDIADIRHNQWRLDELLKQKKLIIIVPRLDNFKWITNDNLVTWQDYLTDDFLDEYGIKKKWKNNVKSEYRNIFHEKSENMEIKIPAFIKYISKFYI